MTNEEYAAQGKKVTKGLSLAGIGLIFAGFVLTYLSLFPAFMAVISLGLGLLLLIFSLFSLMGVSIANQASQKGRSWLAFFWLTILVGPLVMWIIAATISPLPNENTFANQPQSVNKNHDFAEQLIKLAELKEAGVLSQEEFDAKKSDLLDRI